LRRAKLTDDLPIAPQDGWQAARVPNVTEGFAEGPPLLATVGACETLRHRERIANIAQLMEETLLGRGSKMDDWQGGVEARAAILNQQFEALRAPNSSRF
jgi:hypothetical protein